MIMIIVMVLDLRLMYEKPMYNNNLCSEPYNIERDGKMWHIPANTYSTYRLIKMPRQGFKCILKLQKIEMLF